MALRHNRPSAQWAVDLTRLFQITCAGRMARMSPARLLGRSPTPICPSTQRVLSSLPCALLRSSLRELVPATDVAPLSPRAGPHSFLSLCVVCMADMSDIVLSTGALEFIFALSLRRAPYPPPSDPVSRHRTGIVSSSLDQGSLAERISSSLALCPTFDLASAQSSGPVFGQGLFSCHRAFGSGTMESSSQVITSLSLAKPR